jgi:hypothetical protein
MCPGERRGVPSPQPAAMLLIRVSDPTVLPALIGDLEQRAHYVVKQADTHSVAVSVLGSFKDGGELDLTLFLLAWRAAHPQTTINLIER